MTGADAPDEAVRHFQLGQLVTSRAGRDSGRPYLVVGIRPDGKVLVADGRHRPVARAKAKNPRHLWRHDRVAPSVSEQLRLGKPVSDGDLARALDELLGDQERPAG